MNTIETVANCRGVKIPSSPYLNEKRIHRLNLARYEGPELRGAKYLVRAGDSVIEMGAGIGVVGAVAAKNCAPRSVVSFEANPALIPHVEALYDLNDLSKVISVRNELVISDPDRPKSLPFHVHKSFLGSSLRPTRQSKSTVDIPTVSYETLRKDLKPDVILMDIEGGELAFLEHADLSDLRGIVIEFHPKAYGPEGMERCKTLLRDAGLIPDRALSDRLVWVAERRGC